jgi:hypothetical protein
MKENVAHNRKAMLIGGIYTIVTAKVPSVLGGGKYYVEGTDVYLERY